jgi:hypothetical protein
LSVTFKTEIGVALHEQFGVDRAVDAVAYDAPLTEGLVLEDVGAELFHMTPAAGLVRATDGQAPAAEDALSYLDVLSVRVMAIMAGHAPFAEGMMVGQVELRLLVQMALVAPFRLLSGVDDETAILVGVALLDVSAAGPVAGFTALTFDTIGLTGDRDAGVRGELEVLDHLLVAGSAGLHADELGAGNQRGRDHHVVQGRTRRHYKDNDKGNGRNHHQSGSEPGTFHRLPFLSKESRS